MNVALITHTSDRNKSCHLFFLIFLQWLPPHWKWQWLYVVYRWIVALYFFAWFMVILNNANISLKAKYLIYITNWAFIVWNTYLIFAAVSVTINTICENTSMRDSILRRKSCQNELTVAYTDEAEKRQTQLTWYDKLQWLLFSIGTECAVAVTVLYWGLFYDPHSEHNLFSIDSLHMHLINGIVALIELWITAIPIRFYHALHLILFALCYILFTVFYYVASGTDPSGNKFIYPFLNYESNPGGALGLALGCVFIFTTLIHMVFFTLYLCRCFFIHLFHRFCCGAGGQRSQCRGTLSVYEYSDSEQLFRDYNIVV